MRSISDSQSFLTNDPVCYNQKKWQRNLDSLAPNDSIDEEWQQNLGSLATPPNDSVDEEWQGNLGSLAPNGVDEGNLGSLARNDCVEEEGWQGNGDPYRRCWGVSLQHDSLFEIFQWLPSFSWCSVVSVCHLWYNVGCKIFNRTTAERFRNHQLLKYLVYIQNIPNKPYHIPIDLDINTCVFCLHSCYYPILISYRGYVMHRGSKYYLDIYEITCLKCHSKTELLPIRNHTGVVFIGREPYSLLKMEDKPEINFFKFEPVEGV